MSLHAFALGVAKAHYPEAVEYQVGSIEIDGDPTEPGDAYITVFVQLGPRLSPDSLVNLSIKLVDEE